MAVFQGKIYTASEEDTDFWPQLFIESWCRYALLIKGEQVMGTMIVVVLAVVVGVVVVTIVKRQ